MPTDGNSIYQNTKKIIELLGNSVGNPTDDCDFIVYSWGPEAAQYARVISYIFGENNNRTIYKEKLEKSNDESMLKLPVDEIVNGINIIVDERTNKDHKDVVRKTVKNVVTVKGTYYIGFEDCGVFDTCVDDVPYPDTETF